MFKYPYSIFNYLIESSKNYFTDFLFKKLPNNSLNSLGIGTRSFFSSINNWSGFGSTQRSDSLRPLANSINFATEGKNSTSCKHLLVPRAICSRLRCCIL